MTIELTLAHVSSDGLPTKQYNRSLETMDIYLQKTISDSGEGEVFLIETYGGIRAYYVAATSFNKIEPITLNILKRHGQHKLIVENSDTKTDIFYKRYSTDFKFPEPKGR